jgi:ABC-type transporter Mla subunit MlaD
MDLERLISEAPMLGAMVFTVSIFIRYLGKRDQELRHIVELFNERVASLEKTQRDSTETTAVLRETVSNLDKTMRETKTLILHTSQAQDRQARERP